ncbi:MAG: hypothetical protein KDK70_34525 [Myxococcales bacterium]|nr:hypothetical protein [Myxococcales bacterium]
MTDLDIANWIAMGVLILATQMGLMPLFKLFEIQNYAERRHEELTHFIEEIDRTISSFGLGAARTHASEIFRGIATPAGGSTPLRAPLSGRPCLAYRVEFGYPGKNGLAVCKYDDREASFIGFVLDDHQTVILDSRFRFVPSDHAHRLEYRPSEVESFLEEVAPSMAYRLESEWRHGRTKGRFYEWILPVGAPCELVGEASTESLDYRGAGDVELSNARILVGPREEDAVMLDRLRHLRIAALQEIQHDRRLCEHGLYITLLAIACSVWLFWVFFTEIDLSNG